MSRRLTALALSALWLAPATAGAVEIPPLRSEQPPDFSADLVLSLDAEGHPAIGVAVTVPYQGLQWIRLGPPHPSGQYAAAIEIAVEFEPHGGERLRGDVWERRIVVGSFDDSRAPRAAVTERRTFEIPPGSYQVMVTLHDLNAGTASHASDHLTVPDYSKVPVGFADIELGLADSSHSFRPVATRVFGPEVKNLAARLVLFDRRPGSWPRHYSFRYRVLEEGGQASLEGTSPATMTRSGEPVIVGPIVSDLFVGAYTLEVGLTEGRNRWRVERAFEVEESGPPRGQEFLRILEPLSYIATSDEIDYLRSLPPERQQGGWDQFWRRRDPTPDTPRNEALVEFIRRLRYSEHHFQGYGPGWRSDMGRIYIRHGAPDQIENHPASTESPQLEVWYYNNPYRRFVFGDREGFGRYVLLSPGDE
jgi:GWxTD domain-containing protein